MDTDPQLTRRAVLRRCWHTATHWTDASPDERDRLIAVVLAVGLLILSSVAIGLSLTGRPWLLYGVVAVYAAGLVAVTVGSVVARFFRGKGQASA